MFKMFNRCLTTRTSCHDQTKINILQLFHAVINRTNVEYAALLWWDFMNNVFQKKEAIQYPRFIKLIIANLMKKFPDIPQRVDKDYHSIKDDTLLEIRTNDDFKEYETVFIGVDVPMNQPQLVVSTQGMHRSTPRAYRTPTISTANDNDDDVEKVDKGVKEKNNADVAMGSMEIRKENTQTPIPSLIRYPRKVSFSDKTVTEELTGNVSPTPATTSKDLSTSKRKKPLTSYRTKILPGSIAGMCKSRGQIRSYIKNKFITHDFFMGKIREVLDHCNKVVPELTFAKTNEMISKEMPRFINLAVNKDHKVCRIYYLSNHLINQ
ncbi:hypothetical protein Tco_0633486 [Tanacetum coccineum]